MRWFNVSNIYKFEVGQAYKGGIVWGVDRIKGRVLVRFDL
jgi:hypothetical protein